jgi:hypothetical protein
MTGGREPTVVVKLGLEDSPQLLGIEKFCRAVERAIECGEEHLGDTGEPLR